MKSFPLVLLCLLTGELGAQNLHDIDSLRAVLAAHTQEDTLRAKALYQLSREYWDRDLDTAFSIAQGLLELSQRIRYEPGIGNAYNSMGVARWYTGEYPDAKHYHELALEARTRAGNRSDMAASWHNLGLVDDDQGDFPGALRYYLQALKLYEADGDDDGVAQEHGMIAVIHYNQKNYQEALAENHLTLEIRKRLNDPWGLSETYSNMGLCYLGLKDYAEVDHYYGLALELRERIDDQQGLAISYNNYGDLYREQGRYAEALASFDRALAIDERLGYRKAVADVLLGKAHVYEAQGQLHKARGEQLRSLQVAEELGAADHQQLVLGFLAATSARLGDHVSAYAYRLRYDALTDSIFNQQRTRSLVQQQMRYEFGRQQFADSLLHVQQQQATQLKLERERTQRNLLLVMGCVAVIFGTFSYRQRRRTQKALRRSDELLLNILPQEVAEELKTKGHAEARHFETATILFTDFKGFTEASEKLSPQELVEELNTCFKAFDEIITARGIEKIKTIGDAYMCAGGLPDPKTSSPADVVHAALEMQAFMTIRKKERDAQGLPVFEMRLGIHAGPVMAGIVGVKKFQYDIWGDTVNTASRMESNGEVGQVNISEATYRLISSQLAVGGSQLSGTELPTADCQRPTTNAFTFTPRGKVLVKGKGEMEMYFVARA